MTSPNIHFERASDEWTTDPVTFAELTRRYGEFDIDLAATDDNALCEQHFSIENDALAEQWTGRCFGNPPYSRIRDFVQHTIREIRAGRPELVVLLLPARTQTVWWREAWEHADEVIAHSGSLTFGGASNPAPFGSTVFVFRPIRKATWTADGNVRYSMPKKHDSRPRWFTMKEPRR